MVQLPSFSSYVNGAIYPSISIPNIIKIKGKPMLQSPAPKMGEEIMPNYFHLQLQYKSTCFSLNQFGFALRKFHRAKQIFQRKIKATTI